MRKTSAVRYVINRFVLRKPYLIADSDLNGARFKFKTEDVVGRHIYKYGMHEPANSRLVRELVRLDNDSVAIDIGSNIGWYAILLDQLAAGTRAKILAFEPEPRNFALLSENIGLNDATHVEAINLGLADTNGVASLNLYGDSNTGRHSLLPFAGPGPSVNIRTVRLDEFWNQQSLDGRSPTFMKIDVEGYELPALRGAGAVLERCPLLMLEFSPDRMRAGGMDPQDLLALLQASDFRAFAIDAGALQPVATTYLLGLDSPVDLIWRRL